MDINIKETNKGQKCIIVDGHRYRIDITLTNGDISWRCVVKGCKSRLRTGADVHLVLNEKKMCTAIGQMTDKWKDIF
jgi:hypothetical protein